MGPSPRSTGGSRPPARSRCYRPFARRAGRAHRLTHQWAVEGLSLHGLTMSVLGGKFVGYVQFDSVADANRAAAILGDLGTITSAELRAKS